MISELQRHRELMVCTTIGLIVVVLGYWMSSTPPHRSGQPLYNFVVMFLGGFLVGLLVRGGIREGVRSLVFYGMLVSVGTALPGIIHPGPIPSPFVLNLAVFASYIIPPNIVSGVLAILIRNFAEKMKGGMNFIQETGKGLIIPMLGIISGSVVILILQVFSPKVPVGGPVYLLINVGTLAAPLIGGLTAGCLSWGDDDAGLQAGILALIIPGLLYFIPFAIPGLLDHPTFRMSFEQFWE